MTEIMRFSKKATSSTTSLTHILAELRLYLRGHLLGNYTVCGTDKKIVGCGRFRLLIKIGGLTAESEGWRSSTGVIKSLETELNRFRVREHNMSWAK